MSDSRLSSAFAPISGGWFIMGTERGQEDERPPHRVIVDGFELGVFPVTRAEYERFVEATRHEPPRDWSHPLFALPDLHPRRADRLRAVRHRDQHPRMVCRLARQGLLPP